MDNKTIRKVASVIRAEEGQEGGGFRVQRPFPTNALADFDPFLLLDEMGPTEYSPGEAVGAPDHPHRGFETVTYLFAGSMEHKDSHGHVGKLTPGDVQWMTAGAGVIHSELPEPTFLRSGGRMHGTQLWVNLPRVDKMMRPRYQEIPSARIPEAVSSDGLVRVRVVAGESMGKQAVIETRTPIMYLHATIQPGGTLIQPVPSDFNVFAYIIDGEGNFGADEVLGRDAHMVIFDANGEAISVSVSPEAPEPLSVLILGGKPLKEPVVRYGPFVMNTEAEIYQAINDYRTGRFGSIA